jgi:hypothetical protein
MPTKERVVSPHRKLSWLVVLLVCLAGLVRIGALVRPRYGQSVPQPDSIRAVSAALLTDSANRKPLLSAAAVELVDQLRFDPTAAVVLTCGVDGKPGQAGKDDNFNGVVDDSGERGAVGSDDQCVAPWQAEYAAAVQQEGTSTISTGAFVSNGGEEADSIMGSRFVLSGRSGDDSWTWLVIP